MVYQSKVDLWLIGLIGAAMLVPAGTQIPVLARGGAPAWGAFAASAFVTAAFFALAYPVWYRITASHLVIRCGVFTRVVPLERISRVTPSRAVWSSPALSLDRLRIQFGRSDSVLISPEQPERFLAELAAKAPHLVREGPNLVSRPDLP
jgi:hypothetical protein